MATEDVSQDPRLENPSWEYPIRSFFNDIDISHMLKVNSDFDLSSYSFVKDNAADRILPAVSDGYMPQPPSQRWSPEMVQIFSKWVDIGCPEFEPNSGH